MYSESLSKTLESLGAVEGTKLSVVRDGRTYVGHSCPITSSAPRTSSS